MTVMHYRPLLVALVGILALPAAPSQAQTCPAVTNLVTTQPTPNSAGVSATPAAGAVSYVIVCTIYPSSSVGIIFNSVNVSTPTYTFTGLPANTPYSICINSLCPVGVQGQTCSARVLSARREARALQVGLWPNPARSAATLILPATRSAPGASLILLNALGQVVQQRLLPAGPSVELNLTGLAPGVYTVRLQVGDEWVTKRLAVQ